VLSVSKFIFFPFSVFPQGNPDVHVILRGGAKGPNYAAEYVRDCGEKLLKAGLPAKIMVCASTGFRNRLGSHV
jgi:phospho-2-dehydro-3-deoxyheptonate aldolase